MIDSHAHLAMFEGGTRSEVLRRAEDAGVTRILAPATGPGDLEGTLALPEELGPQVVVAVGCHPHEASALDGAFKQRLEHGLSRRGVVAVGEIGLDYFYENSPREDQRKAFAWQLALAREAGLPVVLHQREAWADFLAGLDGCQGVRGVAHCFTEGPEAALEMVRRGLAIGVGGMVTFPRSDAIRETARVVPLTSLLLETDSPYLAPVPYRGQRNEPALVRVVAEYLARLLDLPLEEVAASTDRAFGTLFGASDAAS